MTKEKNYRLTEQERLQIISILDGLVGTRAVANFFEMELPKRLAAEESKTPENKKVK